MPARVKRRKTKRCNVWRMGRANSVVFVVMLVILFTCVAGIGWWLRRADRQLASGAPTSNQEGKLTSDDRVPTDTAKDSNLTVGELYTSRVLSRLADADRALDPQFDGWDSEAFSENTAVQLKHLLKQLIHPKAMSADDLADVIGEQFRCDDLRPQNLESLFTGHALTVFRSREIERTTATRKHSGRAGLMTALTELASPLPDDSHVTVSVKVVRIDLDPPPVTTVNRIELRATSESSTLQQIATWKCFWDWDRDQPPFELPKLNEIHVADFTEVTHESSNRTWMRDCTLSALGSNPSFESQLRYGMNHWIRRLEEISGINNWVKCGLAVGDVNGDGWEDIYLCQPGGLPNRLFVQNADGTARDVSHESGLDWLDYTSSALILDLDNDGDQDVVAGIPTNLLLLENDGKGRFSHVGTLSLVDQDVQSLSAADYDNDGDLDLYVCIYNANVLADTGEPRPEFVYHDANNGGSNVLFRNEADEGRAWQFADATQESGLDVHAGRLSMAASWEDFDNDGDQDLYVANDFGKNSLYRNDGGHFVDIAPEAGVVDEGSGMSVSWSDVDRDGQMDLYVGNMFSSAGNRVVEQQQFWSEKGEALRGIYRRFAKGNSLFRNLGDGTFREIGRQAEVEIARWAWSSLFVDLNNDGWDDAVVANGYITTEDTGDL